MTGFGIILFIQITQKIIITQKIWNHVENLFLNCNNIIIILRLKLTNFYIFKFEYDN